MNPQELQSCALAVLLEGAREDMMAKKCIVREELAFIQKSLGDGWAPRVLWYE